MAASGRHWLPTGEGGGGARPGKMTANPADDGADCSGGGRANASPECAGRKREVQVQSAMKEAVANGGGSGHRGETRTLSASSPGGLMPAPQRSRGLSALSSSRGVLQDCRIPERESRHVPTQQIPIIDQRVGVFVAAGLIIIGDSS